MDTKDPLELELARRCQRNEPGAFDSLYDKYAERVWRLCYRMVRNPADAEDLAQEVWVKIWQRIGSFRGDSAFRAWLYKIATNACLEWLRSKRRKPTHQTEIGNTYLADSRSDPEDRAFNADRLKRLLDAVSALPIGLQLPLVLKVTEGLSYDEIAEALGCTVAAAKMRVSRARTALTKVMFQG